MTNHMSVPKVINLKQVVGIANFGYGMATMNRQPKVYKINITLTKCTKVDLINNKLRYYRLDL